MKTIVSNTSPIRYLTSIGEAELFPQLFGKILIPKRVYQELTHKNTPDIVRQLLTSLPLGILELADRQQKIDLPQAIDKLLKTNIKISPSDSIMCLNQDFQNFRITRIFQPRPEKCEVSSGGYGGQAGLKIVAFF